MKWIMRYLGSKTMLLEQIKQLTCEYANGIFCDPFGGIGTVGAFMKKNGYHVITGDLLNFAHFFQRTLIEFDNTVSFDGLRAYLHLNTLEELERYMSSIQLSDGWFIQEYALKRSFFTLENAYHIQACIDYIEKWYIQGIVKEKERTVLLASLINSFDKVANTAGTYYAFLKQFYRKARKSFQFILLRPVAGVNGISYLMDANALVKKSKCDILYLDPPYNDRGYGSYYHLPETVSLGIVPVPSGKSGVYRSGKKSVYNGRHATEAFQDLVENADTQCIIFHYTDDGLINMDRAKEILQNKGTSFEEYFIDCRGYATTKIAANCTHHIMKVRI